MYEIMSVWGVYWHMGKQSERPQRGNRWQTIETQVTTACILYNKDAKGYLAT